MGEFIKQYGAFLFGVVIGVSGSVAIMREWKGCRIFLEWRK